MSQISEAVSLLGQLIAIFRLKRGIPCNRDSSCRGEYVPALCTHRPSLLPIDRSGELFGVSTSFSLDILDDAKFCEPYRLEEGKVVTRFP